MEGPVKWVTRRDEPVEGVACPWLVTRFVDEDAEFGFVPAEAVLTIAEREGARSFGVPGSEAATDGGSSTFDALIIAYSLVAPGLDVLARIVRGALRPAEPDSPLESAGLRAIAGGFLLALGPGSDVERQQYLWPVFDALLAWCAEQEELR
jgi:hypothetical protein